MEFLYYALASMASFAGLWAGAILAFVSPEEMKPGKRYFEIMSKAVVMLISVLIAFFLGKERVLLAALFVLFCALFASYAPGKFFYPLFGIFFYISAKDAALFPMAASLIFIAGLPMGSLFAYEHKGMKKTRIARKIFICNIFFFILALPLFASDL